MTPADLLTRLAALSRQIEVHQAAVWLLEAERLELRNRLRQSGWTPPPPTPEPRGG